MTLRNTSICLLLFLTLLASSQKITDFENFNLIQGQALNGSDGKGGFSASELFLHNTYNSEFNFWSGWAISAKADTLTANYTNDLSAIAGKGATESLTYAVGYGSENGFVIKGMNASTIIQKISLTNTTYAALSMKNGDAFAKKFGGVSGNDPDFLSLTINGWYNGQKSQDSVLFFLADYRNADNSQDYIVRQWQEVSLSSLGIVDSLSFTMHSSDIGDFGINTPTYFCIDNIILDQSSNTDDFHFSRLAIYPNPSSDKIFLSMNDTKEMEYYVIKDLSGKIIRQEKIESMIIDISTLAQDQYFISCHGQNKSMHNTFIKI